MEGKTTHATVWPTLRMVTYCTQEETALQVRMKNRSLMRSIVFQNIINIISFLSCYAVVDNRIAPSVTASPSSVTVELNGRVTLSCSASGNPTPIIQWYKDNSAIEGPQAIGNTFVIQEATPGDRGFYHCEAFSSAGRSRSTEAALLVSGGNIKLLLKLFIAQYQLL